MENILADLGITQNEIDVYTGFLRNPDITSAQLARILDMDKSSVYRATDDLEKTGLLISSPQKKGTTYIAADPETLHHLYKQKISLLKSKSQQINSYIETLKKEKYTRTLDIRVEYGVSAVQKIMTESHESKEKLIRERFRHHLFFYDKSHVKFVLRYAKRRVSLKIKLLQLEYDLESMTARFRDVMTQHKKYNKEVKILPKEMDDMNSLRIWDDTTNIVSEDENNEVVVLTINDKLITDMMKNLYDFVWKSSSNFVK